MDTAFSVLSAARERPSAPAVVSSAGTLTYADVATMVRRALPFVASADRRPIGVVATLRIETLVVLWAAFEAGVPVVLVHPRATAEERARLPASVGAERVIDETFTLDALPDAPAFVPSPIDDEAALAIVFTSGTSGTPKGVHLSRRALRAATHASEQNLGWEDDDRWLLCMPIAHVGGMSVLLRCLAARKPVVLAPWTGKDGPLLDAIAAHRVSILSLVPTMLVRILESRPDYRFPPHVRAILLGGDATQPGLRAEAMRRGAPILTTYGLSEACAQVATQSPRDSDRGDDVGRPLAGVELRIHDGEIQVRGPTLMSGYVPRDRWPSPFASGGWFPTGDLGELDAHGRLHVRGRRTDRIITGGENVDPLEVERALTEMPGVAAACVFGVADERWGQRVAVAIVPRDPASPPALEAVADHLDRTLATFKRPRAAVICAAFELNATGKVDRAKTAAAQATRLTELPRRGRG
ncbi:MAG TPA: AMP-binding protein [Labilithrix sp.]